MTFRYKDLVVDISAYSEEGNQGWFAVVGCGAASVEQDCTSTQHPVHRKEPIDFLPDLKSPSDYAALLDALKAMTAKVEPLLATAIDAAVKAAGGDGAGRETGSRES